MLGTAGLLALGTGAGCGRSSLGCGLGAAGFGLMPKAGTPADRAFDCADDVAGPPRPGPSTLPFPVTCHGKHGTEMFDANRRKPSENSRNMCYSCSRQRNENTQKSYSIRIGWVWAAAS